MFAIGWPRVLASAAAGADDPAVALEHDARSGATALVTPTSVEIWSCGRDRRCVGRHARSPEAVLEEGAYLAAKWRDGRSTLAVIAEGGRVHLFDLIFADAPQAPPARGRVGASFDAAPSSAWVPPRPPRSVPPAASGVSPSAFAASLSAPPLSPVKEDAAAANDGTCVSVAGDADVLILGTSTGHLVQCAWDWDGVAPGRGLISRTDRLAPAGAIVHLDFASPLGLLVAVVASGRCAALPRREPRARASRRRIRWKRPRPRGERLDRHAWLPGVEDAVLARASRRTLAARDASRWGREAERCGCTRCETTEGKGTEDPGTEDSGTEDPGTEDPGDPGTEDPGTDPASTSPPPASTSPPPVPASPPPASASPPLSSSPSPYSRRWARSAWRIGDTRRVIPGP